MVIDDEPLVIWHRVMRVVPLDPPKRSPAPLSVIPEENMSVISGVTDISCGQCADGPSLSFSKLMVILVPHCHGYPCPPRPFILQQPPLPTRGPQSVLRPWFKRTSVPMRSQLLQQPKSCWRLTAWWSNLMELSQHLAPACPRESNLKLQTWNLGHQSAGMRSLFPVIRRMEGGL